MKFLRGLLAIIFALLIVGGIWKYYTGHPQVQVKNPLSGWLAKKNAHHITPSKDQKTSLDTVDMVKSAENTTKEENKRTKLHEDFVQGIFSGDEWKKLLQLGVRGGNDEGNIVRVHYCDYTAEYCKKSYDEGVAYDYQKIVPDLFYMYKPFPITRKSEDMLPHHAALCAEEKGTRKQALSYYNILYQQEDVRKSPDALAKLGKDLGIEGMKECLQKDNYNLLMQQERKLARKLFKIHALPANIFFNKATKKRILVPGYYEKEEVQGAIERVNTEGGKN